MSIAASVPTVVIQNQLCQSLTPELTKCLWEKAERVNFPPNTVIQQLDKLQDSFFILEKGTVQKTQRDGHNFQCIPGDVIGLLHMCCGENASSTCVSETEVSLIKISASSFKQLYSNPQFCECFSSYLSRQIRKRSNLLNNIRFEMNRKYSDSIAFYDTKQYFKNSFLKASSSLKLNYNFIWIDQRISPETVKYAAGCKIICAFVNDIINEQVIAELNRLGIEMIAMRCAGFDNVDIKEAVGKNISVTRVPAYSPYSVAEFAVALILTSNRKIHKSWNRVREHDFRLDGLVGFDMNQKTVGIYGTGKIGSILVNILLGFGCKIVCYDVVKNPELINMKNVTYVDSLDKLYAVSDIISLHAPLLESTYHVINSESLKKCKPGVIIINVSRGGLIDSQALLDALISGHVGAAAIDVYENEKEYFFEDHSKKIVKDPILDQLSSFHNVIVTSHQAFLTSEALQNISESTLKSINSFIEGKRGIELENHVPIPKN